MKYVTRVIALLCGSAVVTMVIAAMGALVAMFSTSGDGAARTEELWGAVYFQVVPAADGGTDVDASMGIANGWMLFAIFAVLFLFMLLVSVIYDALLRRKQYLLEAARKGQHDVRSNAATINVADSKATQNQVDPGHKVR
ncbi:hypothetical protein [Pseudoscardovia suis]|uniref:Uncharacterized protein n=1 Tax=Pseudoscardovia suis TaxID=987063 RepID=A0A261EWY9_9BIFI|nr:hypothetical protein [Pseudoscardovia suis]OZG51372.1 hypothetical protein PSSU_0995 [Pseudoscardovia suis]PJJ68745.1 hypothetical protein CLV65_0650 [Pseudoscardovia suis]